MLVGLYCENCVESFTQKEKDKIKKVCQTMLTNQIKSINVGDSKMKLNAIKEELKKGSGDENFKMLNQEATSVSGTGSSGAPQNVVTQTHKQGSQEAFDINLKALTEKLESAGETELAEKMQSARNAEEANTITMKHLSTLKEGEQLEKSLLTLQAQNLLQNKDLKETLATINSEKNKCPPTPSMHKKHKR